MHYLLEAVEPQPDDPISPRARMPEAAVTQAGPAPPMEHAAGGNAENQYAVPREEPALWATQLLELARVQAEQAKLIAYYRNELSRMEKRELPSIRGHDQMESLRMAMELMRLAQGSMNGPPQMAIGEPTPVASIARPEQKAETTNPPEQYSASDVVAADRGKNGAWLSKPAGTGTSCLDRDVPGCYLPESDDPAWYEAYKRIEMAEASIISCFLVLVFFIVISRHMDFSAPYAKPKFGKKSRSSSSRTASSSATAAAAVAAART